MKKTSTKKTVTTTVVDTYKLTDRVKMIVTTINGELQAVEFFKHGKRKNANFSCVLDYQKFREQVKQYNPYYFSHPENKKLKTWELIIKDPKELFKLASEGKLSDKNFFFMDNSCHRIEDVDGEYIDIMVRIDYIGGFEQKAPDCDYHPDWDWEKLKKRLEKCKDVIHVEEEEIPYYNCDFHGQRGLICHVIIRKEWVPRDKYVSDTDILLDLTRDPLKVKNCIKKP
jgi:hypothetical protein